MNKRISFVMMSRFGSKDGGRETWANTFLPELEKIPTIDLSVYGYQNHKGDPNNKCFTSKLKKERSFKALIIKPGISPIFLKFISSFPIFYNRVTSKKPDIIVAMGLFELISILLTPALKDVKRVVFLRSIFLNEKGDRIPFFLKKLSEVLERYLLNKVDIVLANGKDIIAHYERKYAIDVKFISNSVESEKWNMPLPELSPKKIKIAYVGRLSKVKGIEDFFKLIEYVNVQGLSEHYHFHLAGDSSAYKQQLNYFEKYGNVTYHGQINSEDIYNLLKEVDVCVALTYASSSLGGGGTSNALLEQMAAGKVILSWDNQIFQQILNADNAYLCQQYSINSLFKELESIRCDVARARMKAESARLFVAELTLAKQTTRFLDYVIK